MAHPWLIALLVVFGLILAASAAHPGARDGIDHWLRSHLHRELRWFHTHLLLALGLVVLTQVLIAAGAFEAGVQYADKFHDPLYWEHRVVLTHTIANPPRAAFSKPLPFGPVGPPTKDRLVNRRWLDAPTYQGLVGQCQCQAWRKLFEWLVHRRERNARHYSCKFLYGLINKGLDLGSVFADYNRVMAEYGAPLRSQYDWQSPPNDMSNTWPIAATVYQQAAAHRYQVYATMYSDGQPGHGGWPAVYQLEHQIVDQGTPANIAMPVTDPNADDQSILNATNNGGYSDQEREPKKSVVLGYHALLAIGVYHSRCEAVSGEQVCGWIEVEQSWGDDFGVNIDGYRLPTGNGFMFVSERSLAAGGFSMGTLHLGTTNPQAPGPVPNWMLADRSTLDKPLAPVAGIVPKVAPGATGRWVAHVYAKDTGRDLAPAINQVAARSGVTAVGLLSVLLSECGLYTNSPRCDRYIPPADVSFGCCQITVQTAVAFGVGNGVVDGYYGPNVTRVRSYEDVASQGIDLAGRVLAQMRSYLASRSYDRCPIGFPSLYVAWNAGAGQTCAFLFSPYGQAGSNYYGNYLGNYRVAWSYATARNVYQKTPPKKRHSAARKKHS